MTDQMAEEIRRDLREIFNRLGKIEQQNSAIQERCPAHHASIEEQRIILQGAPGNGKNPGIIGRVAELERVVALYNWGVRAIWGIVGVQLLTYLATRLFGSGG